jgi:hypothetical protein
MRVKFRRPLLIVSMVLTAVCASLGIGVHAALAADTVICSPGQNSHPFVTYLCPLAAYHNTHVFLISHPEQSEISCPGGRATRVQTEITLLVLRTTTGFLLEGIWIRMDVAVQTYGWFATTGIDGNFHEVTTNLNGVQWNQFGSPFGRWNPDAAVRGSVSDIVRNPRVTYQTPVWLGWGANHTVQFNFDVHEQNSPLFQPNNSSCIVHGLHVLVRPA